MNAHDVNNFTQGIDKLSSIPLMSSLVFSPDIAMCTIVKHEKIIRAITNNPIAICKVKLSSITLDSRVKVVKITAKQIPERLE
ncbi:hypothetical protein VAWG005_36350 [Aeromonas dhakensis]|nr:hypothetical protein VAWG003_36330 [Aeromonas dhakensis]BEE27707.1 hypothetical protein VAWG005_36350 [Aeromonas dhakensis]